MGEIWEEEIKGLSNLSEVERVSEKGVKEDSLVSSSGTREEDGGIP